jgi:Na+-translocating ferredoxin:NAD+ oxidoreductase subunit A
MDIFKIIFLALIANNIALTQFIGVRPLLGQVKNTSAALRSGIFIIIILFIINIILFFIYKYFLDPLQIQFLQTLLFIVLIVSLLAAVTRIIEKSKNSFLQNIGGDLPMIKTNSIILGVCLLAFKNDGISDLFQTIIYTVSSAAGYMLVMVLMAGIAEQMRLTVVPKGMKGFPVSLITIGILALAFMGLTGIFK